MLFFFFFFWVCKTKTKICVLLLLLLSIYFIFCFVFAFLQNAVHVFAYYTLFLHGETRSGFKYRGNEVLQYPQSYSEAQPPIITLNVSFHFNEILAKFTVRSFEVYSILCQINFTLIQTCPFVFYDVTIFFAQ